MRATVIASLLLAACGTGIPTSMYDAGPLRPDGWTPPVDGGPPWAAAGCEPVPYCMNHDGWGGVRFCPAVHDWYEQHRETSMPAMLAQCEHWMRCPVAAESEETCHACRDWSALPDGLVPVEAGLESAPACTGLLCDVPRYPDGGAAGYEPMCPDGGV